MKTKLPATEIIMKSEQGELKKTSSPDEVRTQTRPKDSQATENSRLSETSLTTAGQRKVNLIWEYSQAVIAFIVVFTAMFSAAWVVVVDRVIKVIPADASLASAWTIIATSIGLVVGFYFSRTNHAAIGGVGNKTQAPYEGR